MYAEYAQAAEKVAPFVCDTAVLLNQALKAGESILFEGAQGTMLDIDHGNLPLCNIFQRNFRRRGHRYRRCSECH